MEPPVDLLSLSFKEIQELEGEIGQKEFQRKYSRVLSLASSSGESAPADTADADRTNNNNNNNNNSDNGKRDSNTLKSKTPKKKTAEKWEPVEMSSKIKPKSTSIHASSKQRLKATGIRDPRFDDVSGDFDEDLFEKVSSAWRRRRRRVVVRLGWGGMGWMSFIR